MTKLGAPFEGMSWQETARARTAVVGALAAFWTAKRVTGRAARRRSSSPRC